MNQILYLIIIIYLYSSITDLFEFSKHTDRLFTEGATRGASEAAPLRWKPQALRLQAVSSNVTTCVGACCINQICMIIGTLREHLRIVNTNNSR